MKPFSTPNLQLPEGVPIRVYSVPSWFFSAPLCLRGSTLQKSSAPRTSYLARLLLPLTPSSIRGPLPCIQSIRWLNILAILSNDYSQICACIAESIYYPTSMIRKSHSWSLTWTRDKSADQNGPSIVSLPSGHSVQQAHNARADSISPLGPRISYLSRGSLSSGERAG